jgi:transcriptional regulator with XRE-family HTH domain
MAGLLDAIREAISRAEANGTTRYRIANETGVTQATLSRFVNGEGGLGVGLVERLADYFGLEIVIRPKRKRR